MINAYLGPYLYGEKVISNWESNAIGVYYCGYLLTNGKLNAMYVGKAIGHEGIRGRLLQHLSKDSWPDVSHFGFCSCTTTKEAEDFESSEIKRLQPKYNVQGKSQDW